MNPFVYSGPVAGDHVIDRDEQAKTLFDLAEAGQAARLSAPRRYGKTSLLYRLRDEADAAGFNVVYVDFSRAVSIEDISVTVEEAYRRSLQGRVRQAAVSAIRYLRPRATAGVPGVGVEVSPQPDPEKVRLLGSLLDLPLRIHDRTGTRTLAIFDEFQELLSAGDDLDRLFRSRIQHHGPAASYVFAGSHPGMMEQLFADRGRPFFDQARPIYLEPLADPDLGDYIAAQFEATGRQAGEALEPLLDLVQGHPQRAMLCAHHLWERTEPGQAADLEAWHQARLASEREAGDGIQATWDAMSITARRVIAALASGGPSLLSAETLDRFELAKATASDARDRLVWNGDLHRVGRHVSIVDPLLSEWAHHRIPGADDA